ASTGPAARHHGRVPKWSNGTDCKSVGSAFVGSNPTAPIAFWLSPVCCFAFPATEKGVSAPRGWYGPERGYAWPAEMALPWAKAGGGIAQRYTGFTLVY